MALGVSVLQKEPDVLTICKPASVPVSQQWLLICAKYYVVGLIETLEHIRFTSRYIDNIMLLVYVTLWNTEHLH